MTLKRIGTKPTISQREEIVWAVLMVAMVLGLALSWISVLT